MSGILNALVGGAMQFVQVNPATYQDTQVIPGTAEIQVRWSSTGVLETAALPAGFVTQYNWLLVGAAADYELFVHNNGPDALTTGTQDVWLGLGTGRLYTLQNSTVSTKTASCTVQIRRASDGIVLATATVALQAVGL